MNRLIETFRRMEAAFEEMGLDWALVGGLAVSVHGDPRFTRDIEDGVLVDLLFASSGVEPIVRDATSCEVFAGVVAPVARPGHLAALKLLSRGPQRPQDKVDLVSLHAELDAAEREKLRSLVSLIVERKCNRERDLRALASEYLGSD